MCDGIPYIFAMSYAVLESVKYRTETQARKLFKKTLSLASCLHCLFPYREMLLFCQDNGTLTDTQLMVEELKIPVFHQFWV